jgi:hypothetical protein
LGRTHLSARRRALAGIVGLTLIVGASVFPVTARAVEPANPVLDWNQIAIGILSSPSADTPPVAGQTPPVASIHLAMVHGAVYDALMAIDGGYTPYIGGLPAAPGASRAAAVATAAHDVLVGVPLPGTTGVATADTAYNTYMAGISDGPAKTAGIAIGSAAATAMLANRVGDGRFGSFRFFVPTTPLPGQWVPTSGVNDPFAWVARVRPFTLRRTDQFRTEGPPALRSRRYAVEFNEVKLLGSNAVPNARTAAQTELARFVSANPLPFMNAGFRAVAGTQGLTTAEQARFFALTSMSGADSLIDCWDNKAFYLFWRPQTAIRGAASDGNPATAPDGTWTSFLTTPPYPDEPSGYNCYTAGMMHAAKAFFGTDKIELSLTSPGSGTTRVYRRFTDVIDDTIDGRIYTGFHFRFADVHGAWIGKKVAKWADKHYFQPVE